MSDYVVGLVLVVALFLAIDLATYDEDEEYLYHTSVQMHGDAE